MSDRRTILILSANPRGTDRLRLSEEIREIKEGLQRSRHRDQYRVETAEAVRIRDIYRTILDYEPNIVHFCGHGAGEKGLVFEDETGQAKFVSAEALAGVFKLFADQVECVVLNACYSQVQAEAIAQHINDVIGMSQAIGDKAAIDFAVGFYDALGAGRGVEFAYRLGCNIIQRAGIPQRLTRGNNLTTSPYIERPPIEQICYDAIVKPGGLIRITAPQKMGKNWLLNKVLDYARDQHYQTVKVIFDDRDVLREYKTFIEWFCLCISDSLKPEKTIYEFWEKFGIHRNCNKCFEEIFLPKVENSLVLALVNFEVLLEFPDIFRDFCSLTRTWFNNAADKESIWRKLRIVIVNSTKPYVNYDINKSPFNVGKSVKLIGFTEEQVTNLVKYHQLEQKLQREEEKLKILIALVAGHPNLIQKALTHLKLPQNTIQELLDKASTEEGIFRDHLKEQLEALKKNPKLLEDYKEVINSNTPVRLDDDQSRFKLHSLGLIEFSGNDCVSSCDLYRNYFLDILLIKGVSND